MNILNPIQRRRLRYNAPLETVKTQLFRMIDDKAYDLRLVADRGDQVTVIWRGVVTGRMPPTVHISLKEEAGKTTVDLFFMLPNHVIRFSKLFLGFLLLFFVLFLVFVPGWNELYPVGMAAFLLAMNNISLWFDARTVSWMLQKGIGSNLSEGSDNESL